MKLAGEALDAVRKSLRKQGADLTGGPGLSEAMMDARQEQLELRRKLARAYPIWAAPSPCARPSKACWPMGTFLPSAGGLGWADRARLEPFRKLSRTLKEHSTASWPILKPA